MERCWNLQAPGVTSLLNQFSVTSRSVISNSGHLLTLSSAETNTCTTWTTTDVASALRAQPFVRTGAAIYAETRELVAFLVVQFVAKRGHSMRRQLERKNGCRFTENIPNVKQKKKKKELAVNVTFGRALFPVATTVSRTRPSYVRSARDR